MMQKNKRQVAIELDGVTYRVIGNRLETVRDLKELEGDILFHWHIGGLNPRYALLLTFLLLILQ